MCCSTFNSSAFNPKFSLEFDREELLHLISGEHPSPESHLITALKKDPYFTFYYSLPAGVVEGYTVEEHSQIVLDTFCHGFVLLEMPENCTIHRAEFLFFLALHDIGKGRAAQETSHLPTRKQLELRYTREIVKELVLYLQLDLAKRLLFEALLLHDSVGDYLKIGSPSEIEMIHYAEEIIGNAQWAEIEPLLFFEIMILFHKVDSGSYPALQKLFQKNAEGLKIGYHSNNQAKIESLRKKILEKALLSMASAS